MSNQKAVIEASFAKESGYGNAVFSKKGKSMNIDHMTHLFGPKKEFGEIDAILEPLKDN